LTLDSPLTLLYDIILGKRWTLFPVYTLGPLRSLLPTHPQSGLIIQNGIYLQLSQIQAKFDPFNSDLPFTAVRAPFVFCLPADWRGSPLLLLYEPPNNPLPFLA
jgi:hypothetical protein